MPSRFCILPFLYKTLHYGSTLVLRIFRCPVSGYVLWQWGQTLIYDGERQAYLDLLRKVCWRMAGVGAPGGGRMAQAPSLRQARSTGPERSAFSPAPAREYTGVTSMPPHNRGQRPTPWVGLLRLAHRDTPPTPRSAAEIAR